MRQLQTDSLGFCDQPHRTSNTGCYYAVSNARTRSFFEAMLMLGDRVLAARSHQAAVHTLLSEHASQFGLRIKNLISDHRLLPSKSKLWLQLGFYESFLFLTTSKQSVGTFTAIENS